MARPLKEPDEKRSEVIPTRFTLSERVCLRQQAQAAGLTLAEFIRRRSLGLVVQPPPARADASLVSELNRIGVNVNQLARSQNSGREFRGDWQAVEGELRRLIAKVAKSYGS